MSFERSIQRRPGAATRSTRDDVASPGKRTMVEALIPAAPVQRAGAEPGAASEGADVHAAAAHGTSGPSTALPHLDTIQRAFGPHDVSKVHAHVGGAAAESATAMGAAAFATGDRVAFASQPDLHTAAHEAAHVVQQRAGVHLKGGVGEVGDPHEQHADAVADRVVRGESAAELLDGVAAPSGAAGGSPPAGAVQRLAYGEVKQDDYQQAIFERKAEEWELKLGYALSQDSTAVAGAQLLTDGLERLVQDQTMNLSDTATGRVAPERTGEIFSQGNLRERMGAVYSAIRNGLGGVIDKAAKAPDAEGNGIVDAELVKTEQAEAQNTPDAKWRAFERKGKVANKVENDRQPLGQKEASKNMDDYFKSSTAPTANQVKARGEAPLTTRELEAVFPAETLAVQQATPTWNTLDEGARQARYLEKVGDLPLGTEQGNGTRNWAGGEHYNKLGPNLTAEGTNKDMRMLSGFSGTTDMYLHLADYLKLGVPEKEMVRLAALGTMIPARDHSFHEIMVASTEYGLDYSDGPKGKGYGPFRPLDANRLKALTGIAVFPSEYLKDGTTTRIEQETSNPSHVLTARVPTRSELPKPSLKSQSRFIQSSYEAILKRVDSYHAAAPADRFGIADGIVGAIDGWLAKHPAGVDAGDDSRRSALIELRARALQAGTSALGDLEGDAKRKYVTELDEDADPDQTEGAAGLLAFQAGIASGLTGQGAAALDRLARTVQQADPGALTFDGLQQSDDFVELVAAVEHDRAVRLLNLVVAARGNGKLAEPVPADEQTQRFKDLGNEESAFDQVKQNYTSVNVHGNAPGHPRQGRFKLEGGTGGMRETLQAGRGLSPQELDAIQGYTGDEYKAFNDGTVDPQRRAALISAIDKLPKAAAPLYRGDFWATNSPSRARVGETMRRDTFTSTARSLEDSFIPTKTTAHVYVSARTAANIEGFSKKAWEREGLFGPATFRCVAVVDKRKQDPNAALDAAFDPATNTLSGAHGLPTAQDQARLGNRRAGLELKVGVEDDNAARDANMRWYEQKFSDKIWMFWEET